MLLPFGTLKTPDDGIAVPEPVTNEFAVAPLVSRLIVPAPFVIVTVPPVLVKFAHTGAADVPHQLKVVHLRRLMMIIIQQMMIEQCQHLNYLMSQHL